MVLQQMSSEPSSPSLFQARAPPPNLRVQTSLGVSANANSVHITLLLFPIATRPSSIQRLSSRKQESSDSLITDGESSVGGYDSDGGEGDESTDGVGLAVRLVAALICHGLLIHEGWKLLPLLHSYITGLLPPAQASSLTPGLSHRSTALSPRT